MTIHIEFDIPVYKPNRYDQLERTGRIKVSSNIETIEDGTLTKEYDRLKKEVENLVADINGRTRLAAEIGELEDEIRWKSNKLKDILKDIDRATVHYNALEALLKSLGVLNPKAAALSFDTNFLLSAAGSELELTPTEIYPDPAEF